MGILQTFFPNTLVRPSLKIKKLLFRSHDFVSPGSARILSILGMNLFGCKFCDQMPDNSTQCDRKNFDSLLWALVTVFQVIFA